MDEIFSIEKVSFQYIPEVFALHEVTFRVYNHEVLTILGSNGSGKSTLLQLLCGLLFATEGRVKYKGEVLTEKRLKNRDFQQLFRSEVGFVFQQSEVQLFCPTVFDELVFGPLQLNIPEQEAIRRSEEIMQLMRIEHLRKRPSYMLSGGERKKVAIAAVLTMNPQVILIDEPMSGLDPKSRSFILDLLFELQQAGKTIILATHHLELVSSLQSRVVLLNEEHELARVATAEEIMQDTDLLVRTNLISEYTHKHHDTIHKHLWYPFTPHRHK
ncbi:MAG: energy-coupling factor ABC transporter ATP-binding protein [Bacteroidales bacterium]